jgi:hypothetical protein
MAFFIKNTGGSTSNITEATAITSGLLSATDKIKLDALDISTEVKVAPPLAPDLLTIYINSSVGDDDSIVPTVTTSPFKTFKRALKYLENKYIPSGDPNGENTFVKIILQGDYAFFSSIGDNGIIDGSKLSTLYSFTIEGDGIQNQMFFNAYNKVIFRNWSCELKLKNILIQSSPQVLFENCGSITWEDNVGFGTSSLLVKDCEYVSNTAILNLPYFSNFINVESVYLVTDDSGGVNVNLLNNLYISNCKNVDLGISFEGYTTEVIVENCQKVTFNYCRFSSAALEAYGDTKPFFKLTNIGNIIAQGRFDLDGGFNGPGVSYMRRAMALFVNCPRIALSFQFNNSSTTAGIAYSAFDKAMFEFINCNIPYLGFNEAGLGGFTPLFLNNVNKPLVQLIRSTWTDSNATEYYLENDIFVRNPSQKRIIAFDEFSSYNGENIFSLRNGIKRLDINSDYDLSSSDPSTIIVFNTDPSATVFNINLPSNPRNGQFYMIHNHIDSLYNINFAGVILVPGAFHAVQYENMSGQWFVL